ncbi:glycerol-3-phosphate transporter [Escherichia coli]|uniref:Glycerol-3-phosphate transporter n=1 Tax=Escherichia coli TaxID=562 RepID=A0A376L9H3_ECOLX|nr:glycerol-3-phosphate transporter [Escherichia coli]
MSMRAFRAPCLCGWMSDKVFRGNRGATGVFFMTLVTIATIVYWMNPAGNPTVDMICMIVIGFLIYGPVMLIGLHALELAPKKAAGTAAGFTGLFGYLGGSVAASAIVGYTVDFFGWGWRLYGNDWRQHSGGYLVDCCDDWRKTSPSGITAKTQRRLMA